MLQNIIAFRIGPEWVPPHHDALQEALARQAFVPCTPTQERSAGWIPPRGFEGGAMIELVDGQCILKLAVERKSVPGPALRSELDKRVKAIEEDRGRKPGKKEKAEIKEDLLLEMLPRAFAKRVAHLVWIDIQNRLLVVDAGSLKSAEPVVKAVVDVMAELQCVLPLAPLQTATSPAGAMAAWLIEREAPGLFTIDRDLELKNPGEEKSVVRYARHTLDLEEIGEHIRQGKMPTRLAMTWNDKVSFVLTDGLALRKISIRDVEEAAKGQDNFDADVALTTGELSVLLPDLLDALGGEMREQASEASA